MASDIPIARSDTHPERPDAILVVNMRESSVRREVI
jgi:hypothetical protein